MTTIAHPGRLGHGRMNREAIDQPGEGKHPQHLLPRRVPGHPQLAWAWEVELIQARQIDDDLRPRAATAVNAAAAPAASAISSYPRNATTTWPSHSRVLTRVVEITAVPAFRPVARGGPLSRAAR